MFVTTIAGLVDVTATLGVKFDVPRASVVVVAGVSGFDVLTVSVVLVAVRFEVSVTVTA